MTGSTRPAPIITPEALALELDYAGAGSRLIASLVDWLVITGIALLVAIAGLAIVALGASGEPIFFVGLVLVTLVVVGYFPLLEGLWSGQTIGKRQEQIRVIQIDGTPVTWKSVVVRNLLRLVDQILGIGFLVIVVTPRSQRLGDITAGTVVVHEQSLPTPQAVSFVVDPVRERVAATIDASLLSPKEVAMVRSFLDRRSDLDRATRSNLAASIVATITPKIGFHDSSISSETLLEAILVATRRAGAYQVGEARPRG